jgi:hypothetical protein
MRREQRTIKAIQEDEKDLLQAVFTASMKVGVGLAQSIKDANTSFADFYSESNDDVVAADIGGVVYLEKVLSRSGLTPEQFDSAMVKGLKFGIDGVYK